MFKRTNVRTMTIATAMLFVVSIATVTLPAIVEAAGAVTLGGSANISGLRGVPISLNGLTISGTGTTSIQLRASNGQIELTNTAGVTVNGSNPSSALSYTGTVANISASFAHLTYTTASTGSDTIEISTVDEGQVYYPGNGHIYQVIEYDMDPGDGAHGIDWDTSRDQAVTKSYQGLTGYLATITSEEENSYVSARLGQAGWMGASDAGVEDDWKWVGGPENNTSFWSGDSTGGPVSGRYSNWGDGEPNNAGNEDCTQFLSGGTGEWNDLPCAGNYLPAYVVEFGGPGDLPTVATKNVDVTVTAPTHTVSSCQDLTDLSNDSSKNSDVINLTTDIDCLGATVEPIFSYYGFNGTFNGQGHTIRNFNIDALNGSYSEYGWVGLFMYTEGATIKDLTIEGGTVTGYERVGSLIGYAVNTSVDNVHSSMEVVAPGSSVGGLIGYVESDNPENYIRNSSATGTTTGSDTVGGLVGTLSGGGDGTIIIEKTFATGNVTASGSNAGGMFGEIIAEGCCSTDAILDIHDVYVQGDVSTGIGGGNAGGLVGTMRIYEDGAVTRATISRAYASGDVEGDNNVGGLIGYFSGPNNNEVIDEVSMSFAAGHVSSLDADSTGALVGMFEDNGEAVTWSENYFDQSRTGLSSCFGTAGAVAGSCNARNISNGQPDYFFKKANNPMSDWNFNSIWVAHSNTWPTFSGLNAPDDDAVDDADGISSAVEAAAPNSGDANNDGMLDSEQTNVSSFVNPVTNKYVSLAVIDDCNNSEVSVAGETNKAVQDSGYDYPAGLLSFSTTCGAPGITATITQYYYGIPSGDLVTRKYNPVTRAYFTIPGSVVSTVTVAGQTATKIMYQIKDGGPLDIDGTVNGTIVDPAGPADNVVGTPNTGVRTWQDILLKK